MREKLPHRRLHLTEPLTFYPLSGDNPVQFDVSFGFEPGGPVRECFSLDFKVGSDRQGEVHIACIIISVALQCGQSMSDMARIIGESDLAVAPQTMLGLIIRAGVTRDDHLAATWALSRAQDRIPKPATEAAAADDVERADPQGGQRRTFHIVGAEAGQKRVPVEAPQQVGRTPNRPSPPAHHSDSAHGAEFPIPFGHPFDARDYIVLEQGMIRDGQTGCLVPIKPRASPVLFEGECTPEMQASAPFDAVLNIPAFLRRTSTDGARA